MADYVVADADEVAEGDRIVVEIDGREIGVFKIDGAYHAAVNWCSHQGGPLCEGPIGGAVEASFDRETLDEELRFTRGGRVVSCPWHSWEFDVTTGECLSRPSVTLPTYPAREEGGKIVVTV